MSLEGLPDFQDRIQDDAGVQVLYPYQSGSFFALPTELTIAERSDGGPDLSLAIIRGPSPLLPPSPYGVLDFRLRLTAPMDSALALARQHQAAATVAAVTIARGFLRISPISPGSTFSAAISESVPLSWDGLDTGRFTLTLPIDTAELFKQALTDATVLLTAHGELEMPGVSPRLPLQATFDPAAHLDAIRTAVEKQGRISRSALLDFLKAHLPTLVVQWAGDPTAVDSALLAETWTDWLRMRYAAPVPSTDSGPDTWITLPTPTQVESGSITWDLTQALWTLRPLVLDFDPLSAARLFVKQNGIDGLVTTTAVPAIPTGQLTITVTANLPRVRTGVLALGVMLEALPRPPVRMQTVTARAELTAPADSATLHLRLAPAEPADFTSYGYAVPKGGASGSPLLGPAADAHGRTVRVKMSDFPIDFFPISASTALLDLCALPVTFQPADAALPPETYTLDRSHRSVAFTQPAGLDGATVSVEALPSDGSPNVDLGPLPAAALQLDLGSFPGYGPQQILVQANFLDDTASYAVDLLPEGRAESVDTVTTLNLTADQPARTWGYASTSPFRPGYRYREYRSQPPLADWSAVQDPTQPLTIAVGTAPVPELVNVGGGL